MLVPNLKNKLGFKKGITLTQSIAVLALVALASTDFLQVTGGLQNNYLQLCFWIRTPLMNMAAPMTSELTMNYVGKKNQEMLSAIMAAIWSGSWYFSSQIFRFLKRGRVTYAYIFYITAAVYAFGIFTYYLLIVDYEKKKYIKMGDLIKASHQPKYWAKPVMKKYCVEKRFQFFKYCIKLFSHQ